LQFVPETAFTAFSVGEEDILITSRSLSRYGKQGAEENLRSKREELHNLHSLPTTCSLLGRLRWAGCGLDCSDPVTSFCEYGNELLGNVLTS
jgi:hypothetical protein